MGRVGHSYEVTHVCKLVFTKIPAGEYRWLMGSQADKLTLSALYASVHLL